MAQSHTPCNRCVRFATTVARGHATLATKRTLLLTWAGLPPAGSHQLCLAHSFVTRRLGDSRRDFEPSASALRYQSTCGLHRITAPASGTRRHACRIADCIAPVTRRAAHETGAAVPVAHSPGPPAVGHQLAPAASAVARACVLPSLSFAEIPDSPMAELKTGLASPRRSGSRASPPRCGPSDCCTHRTVTWQTRGMLAAR